MLPFLDQQPESDGSDYSDILDDIVGKTDVKNADNEKIFITGLPTTMPKQRLFNALIDLFSPVGEIKVTERKIL